MGSSSARPIPSKIAKRTANPTSPPTSEDLTSTMASIRRMALMRRNSLTNSQILFGKWCVLPTVVEGPGRRARGLRRRSTQQAHRKQSATQVGHQHDMHPPVAARCPPDHVLHEPEEHPPPVTRRDGTRRRNATTKPATPCLLYTSD